MKLRFESFEIDPQLRELRDAHRLVELEPQVFDLLHYLAANRDRVVGKDELLENIWQGRIVSDSALASRINAARKVVGDDGKQQRLIRTVPKRGFRFVGEVHPAEPEPKAVPEAGSDRPAVTARPAVAEAPATTKPAIAVLPFRNLSGDPEQEFFSDGIAEDITSALSRFRDFFVIAHNSSAAYKGLDGAADRLAGELGVRYVVEGNVRKAGQRIRVAAQLVNMADRSEVWSDRYDRDLSDLFAIQDEITERVVGNVAPELITVEMERARRQVAPMIDTWSRVMRARELATHFDRDDYDEARRLLEEAIAADPDSTLALTDLAFNHFISLIFSWTGDPQATLAAARSSVLRAVELDGRDPSARCMLGITRLYGEPDYDGVLRDLRTALDINPNHAFAHMAYGWVKALSGQTDGALEHCDLAIRHSPRDPYVSLFWAGYGFAALAVDDIDKTIACGQRSVECVPAFVGGFRILAAGLALAGRVDEAREVGAELMRRAPNLTLKLTRFQQPWKDPAIMERFIDALRQAGVPEG